MTTASARQARSSVPAAIARSLDAVAATLTRYGVGCHITRPAGTPVLTTGLPTGPNAVTVAIDPDMHAESGLNLDCTCVWTPAPGTTPEVTAATIATVLHAANGGGFRCRPADTDAARLAAFLERYPGWSAFWDPCYGLWRAAEDDPASVLYVETPDADAVMTYITRHS